MTQTTHSPAASPARLALPSLTLTGLKVHHPLGFLAACGTLRAVTLQGWSDARLSWSSVTRGQAEQAPDSAALVGERVAVLHSTHLGTDSTKAADTLIAVLAAQARADAAEKSERVTWLNWADKFADVDEFRSAALKCNGSPRPCGALSAFACLGTDAAIASQTKYLRSLFDMTSGQQSLLKETRSLAMNLATSPVQMSEESTKRSSRRRKPSSKTFGRPPACPWREALFGQWRYKDDQHSFGLDPVLQRLHALRNKEPEDDKKERSVRAAVFLARQALPLFPVFCSRGRPRTTGFTRGTRAQDARSGQGRRTAGPRPTADRDDYFTWPLWGDRPISLDTLRTLLAQPPSPSLADRGVVALYRSRRAKTGGSQGDYRVLVQPTLHRLP